MGVEVKLSDWQEKDLYNSVVDKLVKVILEEPKHYGDGDHYTKADRFKNQVAKLVADRIYADVVTYGEVDKKIEIAVAKAEKSLRDRVNKSLTLAE